MTNEGVVAVFVRAYGIWNLAFDLPLDLQYFLQTVLPDMLDGDFTPHLMWWSYEFVWLLIYAAMIISPVGFARLLVPKRWRSETAIAWTRDAFRSAVLGLLGVYFLVSVVMDTGGGLGHRVIAWIASSSGELSLMPYWGQLVGELLRLIVGLYLVFGLGVVWGVV